MAAIDLKSRIREVPDWPEPGVGFKDISPLLARPDGARAGDHRPRRVDARAGARPGARRGGPRLHPRRRDRERGRAAGSSRRAGPGKLPPETVSATYALEYGQNSLELHADAIGDGRARRRSTTTCSPRAARSRRSAGLVEQLGRRGRRRLLHHRPDVPRRPRAALEVPRSLADRVLNEALTLGVRPADKTGGAHVRRADQPVRLLVPGAGRDVGHAVRVPARSSGCRAPRTPSSTASRSRAPAATSTRGSSPTTSSTGRRSASGASAFFNLMTARLEDVCRRARRPRRAPDPGGRVAVELLLPTRGAAAAGLPVVVRPARRRRTGRVGLAVRCPVCARTSVNLVTHSTSTCRSTTTPRWGSSGTSSGRSRSSTGSAPSWRRASSTPAGSGFSPEARDEQGRSGRRYHWRGRRRAAEPRAGS